MDKPRVNASLYLENSDAVISVAENFGEGDYIFIWLGYGLTVTVSREQALDLAEKLTKAATKPE